MRSKTSKGVQSKTAGDHSHSAPLHLLTPFPSTQAYSFETRPISAQTKAQVIAQTKAQCNGPFSLFLLFFFHAPAHLPFLPPPLLFCSSPAVSSFPMQLLLQKMSNTPRKLPIEASTRHANPCSTASHMEPCCCPYCCMIQPSSFGYKRPWQRTRKGLAVF